MRGRYLELEEPPRAARATSNGSCRFRLFMTIDPLTDSGSVY